LPAFLGPEAGGFLGDYVKKNDREFGPAVVGIELAVRDDLDGLVARIAASGLDGQRVPPDSPVFRLLV
jgi:threonine dehydratase